MKFISTYFAFFLCISLSFSQHFDEENYLLSQSVAFWQDSTQIKAGILVEHKEVKANDELLYFWYKSGSINHTRGGFSGNLLQGRYIEYYSNHSLKSQGDFSLGLKNGKWKEWNEEGELLTIVTWKKGIKEGEFKDFDGKGNITRSGNYKNNLLNGKISTYNQEQVSVTVYNNGEKKEGKGKFKSSKKKKKAKRKKKIKIKKIRPEKDNTTDKKTNLAE